MIPSHSVSASNARYAIFYLKERDLYLYIHNSNLLHKNHDCSASNKTPTEFLWTALPRLGMSKACTAIGQPRPNYHITSNFQEPYI